MALKCVIVCLSETIQDFWRDVDYSFALVVIKTNSIRSWSFRGASLLLRCCELPIIILRQDSISSREWRFGRSLRNDALRCTVNGGPNITSSSNYIFLFPWLLWWRQLKIFREAYCVNPVELRDKGRFLSSIAVSPCLFPRFGKSLLRHIFAALEEVKEIGLSHEHWWLQFNCLVSSKPYESVVSTAYIWALPIRELVHDWPWALTWGHHHRWYRNKVVLLDELLGIYKIESLICLVSLPLSLIIIWKESWILVVLGCLPDIWLWSLPLLRREGVSCDFLARHVFICQQLLMLVNNQCGRLERKCLLIYRRFNLRWNCPIRRSWLDWIRRFLRNIEVAAWSSRD